MPSLQVVPWSADHAEAHFPDRPERRSVARRCDEQRIGEALGRSPGLIAGLALWVLCWRVFALPGADHAAAAMLLLLAWALLTWAWAPLQRRVASAPGLRRLPWGLWCGLAGAVLLWPLAALAGRLVDDFAAAPVLLARVLPLSLAPVLLALAGLPMWPTLTRVACVPLLALSACALVAWQTGEAAEPAAGLVAAIGLGSGLLAGWVAGLEGRRLDRLRHRHIEAGDRLRRVTAERDAARRADEDKRRFVAAASHDLRQPMHAIGLFAATLERHLQGSPDEQLARNLVHSVESLDRAFGALLDISRLDAGTVQPNIQRFSVRDMFRRLDMQFAGRAEQFGLGLRFAAGDRSVNSDPQLLERILANLIQNGLRYTEHGGVVVVARAAAQRIKLEVWDSGCGIEPGDLPRIFDEFYRVPAKVRARVAGEAPGQDVGQGLGMGLAIVRRLVALLGHTLEVRSMPGRGTVFRIGIATGTMTEIEDATAAADTLPAPFLEARCVLVVDDEAAIREGLTQLLAEWGFEAVAAADLADAHRAAQQLGDRLDLVVSDLHLLHGEDGLDVIRCVRATCGRAVPALLVTGETTPAQIRRAAASGHQVLFKPVQPSKLFSVLRSLM